NRQAGEGRAGGGQTAVPAFRIGERRQNGMLAIEHNAPVGSCSVTARSTAARSLTTAATGFAGRSCSLSHNTNVAERTLNRHRKYIPGYPSGK
ncbi:MAG: hypothetical protein RIF42_00430, partial [Parvibaculaceae bacterium]